MPIKIDLQLAVDGYPVPDAERIQGWTEAALHAIRRDAEEMTVRITDEAESAALNERYRSRRGATNVLSFPFEEPDEVRTGLLGDLVVCAPVVEQEARDQGKSLDAHWAHMIVHGVLHLCGHDHVEEDTARRMEDIEKEIMHSLGFANPYDDDEDTTS
jgi:probable rRNA maturation factor